MNKICILIPLYNDWKSASRLIDDIDIVVEHWDSEVTVLISNDGSTEPFEDDYFLPEQTKNIDKVGIINLSRNMGHQRAIAVGLAYIQSQNRFDQIYVMDSDGEDPPNDLESLRDAGNKHKNAIINAERSERSEGPVFKFFYKLYKLFFFLLTGTDIKFGNFCMIPKEQLDQLVHYPELWNNFSGCIKKSKIVKKGIPSKRAVRYFGPSKMTFMALVQHGLSAISVFKEEALLRMLICSILLNVALAVLLLVYFSLLTVLIFSGGLLVSLNILIHIICVLKDRAIYKKGPILFWEENVNSYQKIYDRITNTM